MTNRVLRGPKWAQIPFYNIENEFWPDRKLMREEAERIRHSSSEHGLTYKAELVEGNTVLVDWRNAHENTPLLNQMLENFQKIYGDFGRRTGAQYFYIDGGSDYRYHVDNDMPRATNESAKNIGVNCCLNIVVTDDESECEFKDVGKFKYTAGVLNTSHLHRVRPATTRILARIAFLDAVYEEVVYRIRKVDRLQNNTGQQHAI